MTKDILVFSCAHTDPSVGNERFDWLGKFIADVKPDIVIDLGDGADMGSLNSFDTRYPQAVVMQNYGDDINHYNEAMDRLRRPYKKLKRKKLHWVGFEGNHENRIKKAIAESPRNEDRTGQGYGISFGHLQTDSGSMTTTNTTIRPPQSLTTVVLILLIGWQLHSYF